MTKKDLQLLQDLAWKTTANVIDVIKKLTADNPLILFDKETIECNDDAFDAFYNLPYAYYVGKHEFYSEGSIWKVHGNNVTIMFRGEEFGDTWELELNEIPYESLVSLLTYLMERM